MENEYNIRVLDRAISILKCFNKDKSEISLQEFVDELKLSKSTAYRILMNLKTHDLLHVLPNGKFVIGNEIIRLSTIANENELIRKEAYNIIKELAVLSGETVILTKYDRYEAVCIDKVESTKTLKIASEIGKKTSLLKGATGKIISAYLEDSELEKCIDIQNEIFGFNIDRVKFKTDLAKIKTDGYCVSYSEIDEGVTAVAAPILSANGKIIGSISVAGPNSRLSENDISNIEKHIIDSCNKLSNKLFI